MALQPLHCCGFTPSARRRHRRKLRIAGACILRLVNGPCARTQIARDQLLAYRGVVGQVCPKAVAIQSLSSECAAVVAPPFENDSAVDDLVAESAADAAPLMPILPQVDAVLAYLGHDWGQDSMPVNQNGVDLRANRTTVVSPSHILDAQLIASSYRSQQSFQPDFVPYQPALDDDTIAEKQDDAQEGVQACLPSCSACAFQNQPLPVLDSQQYQTIVNDADLCKELLVSFWQDQWDNEGRIYCQCIYVEAGCLTGRIHAYCRDREQWGVDLANQLFHRCACFAQMIDESLVAAVVSDYIEIVIGSSQVALQLSAMD